MSDIRPHPTERENDAELVPVFMVSDDPAATILDISATPGVDLLLLGTPHRHAMVRLLMGNTVAEVAKSLPENIQLLIYGCSLIGLENVRLRAQPSRIRSGCE